MGIGWALVGIENDIVAMVVLARNKVGAGWNPRGNIWDTRMTSEVASQYQVRKKVKKAGEQNPLYY